MKKRNTQFLHFSIILVLIMVNSCTQTPPSVIIKEPQSLPVSVTGRVVDIDSNSPIEGAEILLQDVQDIPMFTDKDGYFQSGSNTKPYSGKNEIIIKITKDNYTYKGEEGGKIIKIDLGENDLGTFRLTVITPVLPIVASPDPPNGKLGDDGGEGNQSIIFGIRILPAEIINKITSIFIDQDIVYKSTNNPVDNTIEFDGNEFYIARQSMNRIVHLTFEEFTTPAIEFKDKKCDEKNSLTLRVERDNTITQIDCK